MSRPHAAVALAFLVMCLAVPSAAQGRTPPDEAVILVASLGGWDPRQANGQLMVSVSYPRVVDHANVRRRLQALCAAGGWRIVSVEIQEAPASAYGTKQTGATALLAGSAPWRTGGFWLQPFVETFKDLDRFQVLFVAPAEKGFQGLQHFNSPALNIDLAQAGGPYRYVIQVRSHSDPLPVLPLAQPSQPVPQQAPLRAPTARSISFGLVLGLAGGVGLLVLVILLVRLRLRATRGADANPDRSARP